MKWPESTEKLQNLRFLVKRGMYSLQKIHNNLENLQKLKKIVDFEKLKNLKYTCDSLENLSSLESVTFKIFVQKVLRSI